MNVIKTIYLDMDGVLANFNEGVYAAHGRPDPYLDPASAGVWAIEDLFGITSEDFWKPMDEAFWTGLTICSGADELVNECMRIVGELNMHILTSPIREDRPIEAQEACKAGKYKWIENHYRNLMSRVNFARRKSKFARPDALLIDDHTNNVNAFREAGGWAILVPRMWNSDHHYAKHSNTLVLGQLSGYVSHETKALGTS